MKIKPEQLDKLAKLLLENYSSKELINPKCEDTTILAKIKGVISHNFAEEEAIEDEARKVLSLNFLNVRFRKLPWTLRHPYDPRPLLFQFQEGARVLPRDSRSNSSRPVD